MPANAEDARDVSSIHGLGKFPGEENGNPLQYCLENSMDRGSWWIIVHGVTKSWAQLRTHTCKLTEPQLGEESLLSLCSCW